EDPAEPVEGVNAVVAQLAGAVVPHPVPAVMETIGAESPFRCGAEPEIVVDSRGRLRILLLADIGPRTADPGPRMTRFAKFARANQFSGPGQAGTASALRPKLVHPVVLARGLDHTPALAEIMGGRLFHVDMLAGLTGPNRGQRVPMVGRGHDHGIDTLVFQDAAQVLFDTRLPPLPCGE